jgi:putative redox protein
MITAKSFYKGDLRTVSTHVYSGTEITTDAPIDNKGKGQAFSPTDLLATSLGTCIITTIGIGAQTHGYNIDSTRMEITKVMAADPRRVAEVHVTLFFPPNNFSEKEKKIIERIAHTCPVSISLHPEVKQVVVFNY